MSKYSVENLDKGQLDFMWSMLQLKKKNSCTKSDVKALKTNLDYIRQAMIQKGGGQASNPSTKSDYINYEDLGTYINLAICSALWLYVYGGLDVLENALPDEQAESEGR